MFVRTIYAYFPYLKDTINKWNHSGKYTAADHARSWVQKRDRQQVLVSAATTAAVSVQFVILVACPPVGEAW